MDEMLTCLTKGAGLAPMAGVTDAVFRLLCREWGASYSVSEMLSAKGFLYMPRNTRAARELLMRAEQEGPVALQLFGHEPELLAEAANQLSGEGFGWIDLNMGCPAHKIVSNGEGSALMRDTELAARIVRAVVKRTHLPVTVKLRAGWDDQSVNAVPFAVAMENAGVSALTVHARTRMQFYAGKADWRIITEVKRAVSIPVIGNGDIASGADAVRRIRETGVDGIMIGRAAQGNPWVFRDVLHALRGEGRYTPDARARVLAAVRHYDMALAQQGERAGVPMMRKHIAWYLQNMPGCAKVRAEINRIDSAGAVRALLMDYLQTIENEDAEPTE